MSTELLDALRHASETDDPDAPRAVIAGTTGRERPYRWGVAGLTATPKIREKEAWRYANPGGCLHEYRDGRWLDLPVTRRVIGLSVDDLAAMPTVIAVAGDTRKAAAILGALRAGVLHVLVTDEATAREVVRLDDEDRMLVVADGRVSP